MILFTGAVSLLTAGAASAADFDQFDALHYLLLENEKDLDDAITEIASGLSDSGETELVLGILYVYKYLRNPDRSEYAYAAYNHLERLAPPFEDAPFIFVYKGIANSLMAKEKTVFGLKNLKNMERYMNLIPREYNNWFIRFLRGSTMLQVGKSLPSIFFTRLKTEAIELGTEDLEFVIHEYMVNGTGDFDLSTYDRERKPVPRPLYEQSIIFLEEN